MRLMTSIISGVNRALMDDLASAVAASDAGEAVVDLKTSFGRFSMDSIAACAFGIDPGSSAGNADFVDNAKNVFRRGGADALKFGLLMVPGMKQVGFFQ